MRARLTVLVTAAGLLAAANAPALAGPPPGLPHEDLARMASELCGEIVALRDLPRPPGDGGGRPLLTIGGLTDETGEKLDLALLSDQLGATIDAAGRLRVVLAGESGATRADFGLTGEVTARHGRNDRGELRVVYGLRLALLDLRTREVVWVGARRVDRAGRWDPEAPRSGPLEAEDMGALIDPQIDALTATAGLPGGVAAPPRLLVERVRNRTSEHLDVRDVGGRLVATLLGARRFRVYHVDDRTLDLLAEPGRRIPTDESVRDRADLVMLGEIAGAHSRQGEIERSRFTLTLSLLDRASGELLWMGQRTVRKPPSATAPSGLALDESDLPSLIDPVISRLLARSDLPGKERSLRLGPLRNRTSDHIDMAQIAPRLQMGLLRGRRYRLMQSEPGGDGPQTAYVLEGALSSRTSSSARGETRHYRLTLSLREVENDRIVWEDAGELSKLTR